MRKFVSYGLAFVLATAAAITLTAGDDDDAPKFTIKQVMAKCMKGGLCKKVATGNASDEEKKQLVEYFTALAANKPKKGDADSWKEKTGALLTAAKAAAEGDDDAGAKLMKAANCGACHKAHK